MILLDGSYGEGGGQILRTALVLSLLTDQPFRIENIRLGRPKPGLKPQHLRICQALSTMSDSRSEGLALGSLTLTFYPGAVHGGIYGFEIGTAGAIPLFLQTILPATMFADGPTTLVVTGGTDVRGAMMMDFYSEVILPFLRPYAQRLELQVSEHGFYPVGGGRVKLRVTPKFTQGDWVTQRGTAPALSLPERGALKRVRLLSCASKDLSQRRVAERQASAFKRQAKFERLEIKIKAVDSASPGSSVTALAEYEHTRLGADALGEREKTSEQVGEEAAQRLLAEMQAGGVVDVHTADNLLLWTALFGGDYSFGELTGHIATNAWTINHFLPGALQVEEKRALGR
jgi:RNA 3'-phosphate cyclase